MPTRPPTLRLTRPQAPVVMYAELEVRPSSTARGYNAKWRKARETFLLRHPLCVMCAKQGRHKAATVVDHVKPHRGDSALFWDSGNWQALCKSHHDSAKQSMERGAGSISGAFP